jgi:DNA-binding transcriptional LysR family regulator
MSHFIALIVQAGGKRITRCAPRLAALRQARGEYRPLKLEQPLKLDPLSLRLFVRVVEEGTIAAVAEQEHIAAPAVSKRLKELEELFGTPLLVRTNKGITPTAAGMNLSVLSRDVLDDLRNIVLQMKAFSDGLRGAVRVLVNISAMSTCMPALVKSFSERYPDVNVSLLERDSLAITEGVAANVAEIGVFTRLPHSADIEVHPFRSDELKALVPANHPLSTRKRVTFTETLDYEHVVLRAGTHLRFQMLNAASQAGKSLRAKVEVSSYDALCKMVQVGMGIGILPAANAAIYRLPGIRMLKLDEPWANRELVICVRRADALSPVARLFFDHLRASP